MEYSIIFPHQLFENSPLPLKTTKVLLIEEHLFFNLYKFHKQKICWQRASMRCYADFLTENGIESEYVSAQEDISDIRKIIEILAAREIKKIHYIECSDNWLEKRIYQSAQKFGIELRVYDSPLFLNTKTEIQTYFKERKKFFQTDFYIDQRKKRNILVQNKKPVGGRWTFDTENRLKYPKDKIPPPLELPENDIYFKEALTYTKKYFSDNYGNLNQDCFYPHSHEAAKKWLDNFLEYRLWEFGPYEDAIAKNQNFLHHSLLSPLLNSGLLTPEYVIEQTLEYHSQNPTIGLNSLEGFIRQITGWREFIRAVYELRGTEERNKNFWNFKSKIPESFWRGETNIPPLDNVIKKVLENAYCHHIERLMVLGNFMLLCEFDPDEVYRWFMELFIDAYDWVMVPNVYGMSQFSDGGLLATKPYISGSNYLLKMSDFPKGEWQNIWDALFWRFMHVHRDFFLKNPRLGMLVHSFDKMPELKRKKLLEEADNFLSELK
jgi:deoxyribodipyrimidine photolyase-related protein